MRKNIMKFYLFITYLKNYYLFKSNFRDFVLFDYKIEKFIKNAKEKNNTKATIVQEMIAEEKGFDFRYNKR